MNNNREWMLEKYKDLETSKRNRIGQMETALAEATDFCMATEYFESRMEEIDKMATAQWGAEWKTLPEERFPPPTTENSG